MVKIYIDLSERNEMESDMECFKRRIRDLKFALLTGEARLHTFDSIYLTETKKKQWTELTEEEQNIVLNPCNRWYRFSGLGGPVTWSINKRYDTGALSDQIGYRLYKPMEHSSAR